MANAILNFHFDFPHPSLIRHGYLPEIVYEAREKRAKVILTTNLTDLAVGIGKMKGKNPIHHFICHDHTHIYCFLIIEQSEQRSE